MVFGVVTALGTIGVDVSAFVVAELGLTGFALGFDLKDILANVVSGVLILLSRPFEMPGLGFRFADAKRGPSVPVGRDGVFEAFTPPYHDDMGAAVYAFLERKWSQYEPDKPKAYLEPDKVTSQIEWPTEETIQIVKDYCTYVHDTYGRFPAYLDPMYQRLTAQAQHVDPDFYAQYYPPGALTEQHHAHFERVAPPDGRRRRPATSARGLS